MSGLEEFGNVVPSPAVCPQSADLTEWELLLQCVRSRTVIPFTGAGLSVPLLPGWQKLIDETVMQVKLPEVGEKEKGDLPMITDMLRETLVERLVKEKLGIDEADGSSSDPLVLEFLEVFARHLNKHFKTTQCLSDSLLLGKSCDTIDCSSISDVIRKHTRGHRAITTGPWSLILTTNWDTILEASYGMMELNKGFLNSAMASFFSEVMIYNMFVWILGDIWDDVHPEKQYFQRIDNLLPVRYRKDMHQVFAELQAGMKSPRLLKLHGDFTKNGSCELVAGHSDYRHLMVHDFSFNRFMQYLCSRYNFLFYGHSLHDPDMLAVLDSMIESLGSEVGPHFWITAGPVSDARKQFLMKNYSVYTIRTEEPKDYSAQLQLLIMVCNQGWPIPRPLSLENIEYKISDLGQAPAMRVSVQNRVPEEIASELKRSGCSYALAVMVNVDKDGTATVCHHSNNVHNCGLLSKQCVSAQKLDMTSNNWRAQHCSEGCWLLCIQAPDITSSVQTTFEATQHFVLKASSNPTVTSGVEFQDKAQSPPDTLTLILPLLRRPDCLVQHDEVINAMISAIGDVAQQIVSPVATLRIIIALGVLSTGRNRLALFAEIDAGRIHLGKVLNRSLHGHMEFTCVAPTCSLSQLGCDEQDWRCRKLHTGIRAPFNDLRKQMGYPVDPKEKRSLLEVNITDGSVYTFSPSWKAE